MDRETILKHSKSIRFDHKVLPDFIDVIAEFCAIKGHSEHTSAIIQLLQRGSSIGSEVINLILEYFEKEFHIIRVEKLLPQNTLNNIFGNISQEQKQIISIY